MDAKGPKEAKRRVLCFVFGWLFAAAAYAQTEAHERLFLVHLTLGPAWRAEAPASAQTGFGEHSANLARLRGCGRLLVGARYADKRMLVVRATDRVAVEREFAADPMVANGAFRAADRRARAVVRRLRAARAAAARRG